MTIRTALADDAPAMVELMALLGHGLDPSALSERLERTGAPTLLAVEEGRVVGLCGLAAVVHVHRDKPVGRITILVVGEGERDRGIGTALVDEAERRLAALGCGLVEVTSNFRFESGHAFYEARGFTRTSFRFAKPL